MVRWRRWLALVVLIGVVVLIVALVRDEPETVPDKIEQLLETHSGCEDISQDPRSRSERPDQYRRFRSTERVIWIGCSDPTAAGLLYYEFRTAASLRRALKRAPSRRGPFCAIGPAMFDGDTADPAQARLFCNELGGMLLR